MNGRWRYACLAFGRAAILGLNGRARCNLHTLHFAISDLNPYVVLRSSTSGVVHLSPSRDLRDNTSHESVLLIKM